MVIESFKLCVVCLAVACLLCCAPYAQADSLPSPPAQHNPSVQKSKCLTVSDAQGTVLLQYDLYAEERFALRHIHSVHKSPVMEYLGAGPDDTVAILEGQYEDYGAGLPQAAESGQRIEFIGGRAQLLFTNRNMPQIEVRVGRIAEHTLFIGDKTVPLASLTEPGQVLVFRIVGGACGNRSP